MFRLTVIFLSSALMVNATEIPEGQRGFDSIVKRFLKKYCIDCHGPRKAKGKMALHNIGDPSSGHDLDRWEKILEVVKSAEMPPEDEKTQPSKKWREAISRWIDSELRQSVAKNNEQSLEPLTRRLTNFEYQNTMRDLLGFELNLIDSLPQDPIKPYSFNNSAHFMRIGLEQLDRYKEAANRAMASAIVDPAEPKIHRKRHEWKPTNPNPTEIQSDEIGGRRHSPRDGMGLKSWPKTGEFRVRVKAAGIFPRGVKEVPLRLVMGYSLGKNSSALQVEPVGTVALTHNLDNPQVFEFRGRIENFPVKKGNSKRPDSMAITPQNIYDDGRRNDNVDLMKRPRIAVKWIEFEAPVFETWPPKHHTAILFESPFRKSSPHAYAKAVLERFISRAFRRPASRTEVNRYAAIYRIFAAEFETVEEAMRATLAMVLISPDFLYHRNEPGSKILKQYELASKLSYFLWGSMPDQELFDLAKAGKLTDNRVIESQVKRLLKDKRVDDFIKNFTVQWLSLAKMKQVAVNRNLFPRFLYLIAGGERAGVEVPYIPTVRDYMISETVGFMGELVKRNASVLNIVHSNFAYLNQRLAAHYGVDGVEGHDLRPVPIKKEHKLGGLLTHGSVLLANSTGSAPHPIYRAVWLREAILGDEVEDPPADIPALSDTAGESIEKSLSIKDSLVKHRQKESCNVCHARLDPWGVAFECYNAIGQYQPLVPEEGVRVRGLNNNRYQEKETLEQYQAYRQSINTVKVEADIKLPGGPKVDGLDDLKEYLIKYRRDDIVENMIRRLLTYAIGRELTYRDRYEVEKLVKQSNENGNRLQDIIISICQSQLFKGEK